MTQTTQDAERDPTIEPKSSAAWLQLLCDAEQALRTWQSKSDSIDKLYADLSRLSTDTRDREFQMFWANIQTLCPAIYSRAPVPVVIPRFKDRDPVKGAASELLERSCIVGFEQEDMHDVMKSVRDDLAVVARGVIWCRYEKKNGGTKPERACIEHLDRKDFLHEPSRKWREVDWVARRGWMTEEQMKERFEKHSKDAYKGATFTIQKDDVDNGAADKRTKAGVWEIWCKSQNKVVWVTEGVDALLDEGEPHLQLEGFFPCPKPAYGTTQRRSLVPVPDYVFYKDQLEEINDLTARISALTDSVQVRGFYPAGAGEIADAVQTAVQSTDNRQILVAVSNWAMFGGGGAQNVIVWLPLDMVVNTIQALVNMRRQLIEDVYQITGLSDIMRGATDPNETLGAQQLKSQYGSVRVRDRQEELVRIALETCRIMAEIMAENFDGKTLMLMSQTVLPTNEDIKKQLRQIEKQAGELRAMFDKQVKEAQDDPETKQMIEQDPQQAQQIMQQAQQQLDQQIQQMEQQGQQLQQTVTIDRVMDLLRDQRLRPFALEIETDSTIQPDENSAKQRATEFVTAVGGFMSQAIQGVQAVPQSAPLMAQTLKYVASQFRAGRELDAAIDEFAEQITQMAGQQGQQPNPEAEQAQAKAQAEQQRIQGEMQIKQAELQGRMQEMQLKAQIELQKAQAETESKKLDAQVKQAEAQVKIAQTNAQMAAAAQKHEQEMQKGELELEKLRLEIQRLGVQTAATAQQAEINAAKAAMQPAPAKEPS